jgi:hypothetical protein
VVVTRLPLGLEKPLIKPTIVYLALKRGHFQAIVYYFFALSDVQKAL